MISLTLTYEMLLRTYKYRYIRNYDMEFSLIREFMISLIWRYYYNITYHTYSQISAINYCKLILFAITKTMLLATILAHMLICNYSSRTKYYRCFIIDYFTHEFVACHFLCITAGIHSPADIHFCSLPKPIKFSGPLLSLIKVNIEG